MSMGAHEHHIHKGESLKEAAREHVWWEGHRKIEIISAALGANAGVIGAAAILWAEARGESPSRS